MVIQPVKRWNFNYSQICTSVQYLAAMSQRTVMLSSEPPCLSQRTAMSVSANRHVCLSEPPCLSEPLLPGSHRTSAVYNQGCKPDCVPENWLRLISLGQVYTFLWDGQGCPPPPPHAALSWVVQLFSPCFGSLPQDLWTSGPW